MEKLAFLLLGWLLGLLAPIIVDAIKRQRENKLGRAAIRNELASLKIKLAYACYMIYEHQGTMNCTELKWVIKHISSPNSDAETLKVSSVLKKLIEVSDDQLNQYFSSKKALPGKSLTLQRYGTPLLDARVAALWTFNNEEQRTLLEIRSAFDISADIVERARHFSNLTFQKLENGNYSRAVENVEGCYTQYASQARRIIELIERFENASAA